MITKFLVLGIDSASVLTDAWLTSDGVHTEEKGCVALGIWQGDCDTYPEALALAEELLPKFREGVTILPIMVAEPVKTETEAEKMGLVGVTSQPQKRKK